MRHPVTTTMITAFCNFMDVWNRNIGMTTPAHHKEIMEFLVDVLENSPHRGLLTAFRRMVNHIRNILENHPLCVDMVPKAKKEWANGRITINRPVGIREPSVICQGIHGNITGARADLIICDDVEVPNTCNTSQKRDMLRERLRELDFILSPNGAIIYIGTPHTTDTIYRTTEDA